MLICITHRKLCKEDFLDRMRKIVRAKPDAVMLREKDMDLDQYEALAIKVKDICQANQVPLIINQNIFIAKKLDLPCIHLSMPNLRRSVKDLRSFSHIGASVHSLEEAKEAEKLGATYLVAGHIFATNSKKGIPPRGLSFLKEICDSVTVPVLGIGGITEHRVKEVIMTGAEGICIMSEAMTCSNPFDLINAITKG